MTDSPKRPIVLFRSFEERDVPALLDLWQAESGWGQLTEQEWRSWNIESPYGPAIIAVAEDEHGAIGGQAVFSRARLVVDGKPISAVRLGAPILRADLRSAALRRRDHPVIGLYGAGIELARRDGVELMFARPAATWEAFFRAMQRLVPWTPGATEFCPRVIEGMTCVERAADAAPVPMPPDITVDTVVANDEFDDLWSRASRSLPVYCGAVRDAVFMEFRNGRFQTYGTRSASGELMGYVSVDLTTRLIVDSLGVTVDALRQSLVAVVHTVLRDHPGLLKAMETPLLANVLTELDFVPNDYRFLLVCDWLDGARDASPIALERWHVGVHD